MAELVRRAGRVIHADLALDEMCRQLDGLLRSHVSYLAAAWSTHDPATGLTTSCILTGIPVDPEREASIFQHEFLDDEPATYLDLITDKRTVAVLSRETGGDLSRAARWREVFSAFGVTDELRAILWSGERAWGSLSLYRVDGVFEDHEVTTVSEVAPIIAEGIRLGLLRAAASRPEAVDDPPGILEIDASGDVQALTEPARHWLDVGGEPLRSAARAAASAVRTNAHWAGTNSRLLTDGGQVLTLHAASTTDGDGVAVIVEAARPVEVGAMLVDAYGLTKRQRDVLGLLLLGHSMIQIAHALGISEHTANDHRKAIYGRVGVSSRSELAALLQNEQYDPRTRDGMTPSPYGGFLTA